MPTLVYGARSRNSLPSAQVYYPDSKLYIQCSRLIDSIMAQNRAKKIVVERDRFTYSTNDGGHLTIRLKKGLR